MWRAKNVNATRPAVVVTVAAVAAFLFLMGKRESAQAVWRNKRKTKIKLCNSHVDVRHLAAVPLFAVYATPTTKQLLARARKLLVNMILPSTKYQWSKCTFCYTFKVQCSTYIICIHVMYNISYLFQIIFTNLYIVHNLYAYHIHVYSSTCIYYTYIYIHVYTCTTYNIYMWPRIHVCHVYGTCSTHVVHVS